ncbi:hypothetical protein BHM03_00050188 [Ensete ventricosum]|nr:hypothetical protein BHM03_00050188 [Ensete ventricosum]
MDPMFTTWLGICLSRGTSNTRSMGSGRYEVSDISWGSTKWRTKDECDHSASLRIGWFRSSFDLLGSETAFILLDLDRCSGDYIDEVSQSSKCICGGRTMHKLFSKTEQSKGDGGLQNFQWEEYKRKVALT